MPVQAPALRLKVVAVSLNTNSFGLRSHVFVGSDGHGYEACANQVHGLAEDTVLEVPAGGNPLDYLAGRGFECPGQLGLDPPPEVLAQVWPQASGPPEGAAPPQVATPPAGLAPDPEFDLVGQLLAFENNQLDHDQGLVLFQHLVDTGLAWKLQGSYGRVADQLLAQGSITNWGC